MTRLEVVKIKEFKIFFEDFLNKDYTGEFLIPKHPENNLRKIKEILSLSDRNIAEKLGVKPSHVSTIINGRGTLSGGVTINFLKEFNLSFSSMYNLSDFDIINVIVEVSKSYDIYDLIQDMFKHYKFPETALVEADYYYLKLKDSILILDLDDANKKSIKKSDKESDKVPNRYLDETVKNMYFDFVNKANIELSKEKKLKDEDDFDYIFISLRRNLPNENFDKDINNILFNIPFRKLVKVTISESGYEIKDDTIILDKNYDILRNNEMISTNILNKEDYSFMDDKKTIFFNAFSSEKTNNKFKVYRYLKGYDINYMAETLGISPGSYKLLEFGTNKLSTRLMFKVEKLLGVQIENIIDIYSY